MARKKKKSSRRKRLESLLYKFTHRDYKGRMGGKPSVMILRSSGSTIVPVEDLTNRELVRNMPRKAFSNS
jgi:hypothetical protein